MATTITSECINCGACEPECPNTAIYQGGVQWEFNGQMHPALSEDIFYIVPEKCTECVGFHDHEACAAVCPVDCCIPDPNLPESEEVLIARARDLHPGTEFPADFPSRFRKEGGDGAAPAASTNGAPAAAPTGAASAAPAAAAAAQPQASVSISGRVEKPLAAPKPAAKPMVMKEFGQELPELFEDARARLSGPRAGTSTFWKVVAFLASPLLGALPVAQKRVVEQAVGDPRVFSTAGATGLNAIFNMILYPTIAAGIAALFLDKDVFSTQLKNYIVLGVALASFEAMWRMKEGLRALPMDQIQFRAALYGAPLAAAFLPIATMLRRSEAHGSVGVDGFHGGTFEEKTERERRYGEVYSLKEEANGYYLRFEFPRQVPKSGMKEELGVPDEMPGYDYDLSLEHGAFVVKGSMRDPEVRKLAAVSPAFPPDFTTKIDLSSPVAGFKHRIQDKVLEVVLLKS